MPIVQEIKILEPVQGPGGVFKFMSPRHSLVDLGYMDLIGAAALDLNKLHEISWCSSARFCQPLRLAADAGEVWVAFGPLSHEGLAAEVVSWK